MKTDEPAIEHYMIVKSLSASELETAICENLKYGWELQGGISMVKFEAHNDFLYAQAMISVD